MTNKSPIECACFVPMADGSLLEVVAVASQAEGRGRELASVTCCSGSRAFKRQVKEVIDSARLTEFAPTNHWQVKLYFESELPTDDRSWELAAVVADRMARGILPQSKNQKSFALGCSDRWESGLVDSVPGTQHTVRLNQLRNHLSADDRVYLAHSDDTLAELEIEDLQQADADISLISHLGGLLGQPDPSKAVRRSRVWFPLISGNVVSDRLAWVEVAVLPINPEEKSEVASVIQCKGAFSKCQSTHFVDVLEQSRSIDVNSAGRWQTTVRFSQTNFSDNSYELALVMADRIARGREVPAQARLIATGCSDRWATGRVNTVGGCKEKSQLLNRDAVVGDRVLVPAEWQSSMEEGVMEKLEEKGVSFAFTSTIVW